MKILFLADPNSEHTIKWANALYSKNIEIQIFGITCVDKKNDLNKKIKVYSSNVKINNEEIADTKFSKVRYLKDMRLIKKIIKEFRPDIIHSHYASSYGLMGAMSGFHPFIISVWGSDVFDFPRKSFLHKKIFNFVLKKADEILSTSNIMVKEISSYTDKKIQVTPFGVDVNYFKSFKVKSIFNENSFVIGTVKSLEKIYGIDTLLLSFNLLKLKHSQKEIKLLIIGDGTEKENLIKLSKELNIYEDVLFAGKIVNSKLPDYYNMMDVAVFLSRQESFGVSVLEASSCEIPVVVSNAGGLPEIVDEGITGFIVEKDNPQRASESIEKLMLNENLRKSFGKNGRENVLKYYNFDDNLEQMVNIYKTYVG
jgi:L-malate glycosyltransferase